MFLNFGEFDDIDELLAGQLKFMGTIIILNTIFLNLWKWSIGNYLFNCLPDKEEVNIKKFRLSIILNIAFGLILGFIVYTGFFISFILSESKLQYFFFFLLFLFIIKTILFSRINLFPYIAAKAILQQLPYRAITLNPFSLFFLRAIGLQKDVNKIEKGIDTTGRII